jgi:hypothetical protein
MVILYWATYGYILKEFSEHRMQFAKSPYPQDWKREGLQRVETGISRLKIGRQKAECPDGWI